MQVIDEIGKMLGGWLKSIKTSKKKRETEVPEDGKRQIVISIVIAVVVNIQAIRIEVANSRATGKPSTIIAFLLLEHQRSSTAGKKLKLSSFSGKLKLPRLNLL